MPRAKVQSPGVRVATAATVDPGAVRAALPMPKPEPEGGWHPAVVDYWRALTRGGVYDLLLPHERVDVVALLRMKHRLEIILLNPEASPSAIQRLATEVRAQAIALGLSPAGRKSLSVAVATPEPERRRGLASVSTITAPGQLTDDEHADLVRRARGQGA